MLYDAESGVKVKMGDLKVDIDSLRGSLGAAKVLTPDSVAYSDSIRRWSEAAEKPAVNIAQILR